MRRAAKILFARRLGLALVILFAHILQNTRGLFLEIAGVRANLLIPLVVCIGMFERETAGAFFGLFAGVLWDTVSGLGDGWHALFLTLVGAGCGLLVQVLMRSNLGSALILSGAACLLYAVLYELFFVFAQRVDGACWLFFRSGLPSAFYSFAFTPLWYRAVRGRGAAA